jgi:hypothetical protein
VTEPQDRPAGIAPVLQDGLFAGVIGAVTVLVVFFLVDLVAGDALRTPSTLGALLFEGAEAAARAESDLEISIAYNAVHFLLWLLAGLIASYLCTFVHRYPKVWYLVFVGVAFAFAAFLYLDGAFGVPGLGRFQLWLGAVLGAAAMGVFLWWRHPGLGAALGGAYQD